MDPCSLETLHMVTMIIRYVAAALTSLMLSYGLGFSIAKSSDSMGFQNPNLIRAMVVIGCSMLIVTLIVILFHNMEDDWYCEIPGIIMTIAQTTAIFAAASLWMMIRLGPIKNGPSLSISTVIIAMVIVSYYSEKLRDLRRFKQANNLP